MTAPTQVGSYLLQRKIGEGGMGAIFEGTHETLGRRVAIKILHPEYAREDEITVRLFNEARMISQIEHPGVVQVFDFGRLPDGTTYIVMELLKGQSLGVRLRRNKRLSLSDALRIGWQIANALATVHEQGVVHRDLKPDNVFLVKDPVAPGGERAKVLDFGLAKMAERPLGQIKTRSDVLMGTPAYMSPEQCRGAGGVTDKTDVYALGVMLYEALSGRLPFFSDGIGDVISMHISAAPPSLAKLVPDLPKDAAELVQRLLVKDKDSRPSMREVVTQLEEVAERCAPDAIPNPGAGAAISSEDAYRSTMSGADGHPSKTDSLTGQRSNQRISMRLGLFLAAASAAALLITGAYLWPRYRRQAVPPPPETRPLPVSPPPPPITVEPPKKKEPPQPPPKLVHWSIVSKPAGATVTEALSGEVLGRTPFAHSLSAKSGLVVLTLRLPDYADLSLTLAGDRDAQLKVKLQHWAGVVPPSSKPKTGARPPKTTPDSDGGFIYEK